MTFATDRLTVSKKGLYDVVPYVDLGMSDEFNDASGMSGANNGLAAQWTAVAVSGTLSSGTVAPFTAHDGGSNSIYDLSTAPGSMLWQIKEGDDNGFRIDDIISDGEEICLCVGISSPVSTANGLFFAFAVNDNDTDASAGTKSGLQWDGTDDDRWIVWEGVTPILAKTPPSSHTSVLRMVRTGNNLWTYISWDGLVWSPLNDAVNISTLNNTWVWTESATWGSGGQPIHRIYWVRHTTYQGYVPEWAEHLA